MLEKSENQIKKSTFSYSLANLATLELNRLEFVKNFKNFDLSLRIMKKF